MKTVYFFTVIILLSLLFIIYQYLQYLEFRSMGTMDITHEHPKLSSAYIEQNPWKPECEEGFKIAYSLNLKYDHKEEGFIYGPLQSIWCVME